MPIEAATSNLNLAPSNPTVQAPQDALGQAAQLELGTNTNALAIRFVILALFHLVNLFY